jgi:hypothetical protein
MKKTKLFALMGLATLAVVSVFGTKPTRKFSGATELKAAGSTTLFSGSGTSSELTIGGNSGSTGQVRTKGGQVTINLTQGGTAVQHVS